MEFKENPALALGELTNLCALATKALGLGQKPWNKLTANMVKAPQTEPRLKLKASETRRALKCIHFVLVTFLAPRDAHETLVLQCVATINNIYLELENWAFNSAAKVARLARVFVGLYGELNMQAFNEGNFLKLGWHPYKLYPKFHLFIHLFEEDARNAGNPRTFWCYADESEIGDAVRIAESSHASFLHRAIIDKYRL